MEQQEAELLCQHQGLVWSIVQRYRGRGVEEEDLISACLHWTHQGSARL